MAMLWFNFFLGLNFIFLCFAAEASPGTSSSESKERVVAPRRRKRKTDESLHEAIDLIKTAINNDPVKEVLSYMSDQAQKSREHELNMLQMLLQAMHAPFRQSFVTLCSDL